MKYSFLPPLLSEEARMEFIRRKKQIEFEYARPFLKPVANPGGMSEKEVREMVRGAIEELPMEDRAELSQEKREAYKEIALEEYERLR